MRPFSDRLKEACAHRGIPYSQTAIAKFLGVAKQTVDAWFNGGEPKSALIFVIADKLHVSPRWLATEEGSMLQLHDGVENLTPQESELLDRYRRADPQWKRSISTLIKRAAVVIAMAIPPLLPSKSEAFNITLNSAPISRQVPDYNTHWLRIRRWLARFQGFLTGICHGSRNLIMA